MGSVREKMLYQINCLVHSQTKEKMKEKELLYKLSDMLKCSIKDVPRMVDKLIADVEKARAKRAKLEKELSYLRDQNK